MIGAGWRPEGHAGPSAGRQVTARGFLGDYLRANFSVGDSCHVVGSERNIPAVWDGLAGNEVRRFPSKVGRPREGSGPIGAPDSGDDVSILHGPSPRAAGPKKVEAVPPPLSCLFSLSPHLSRSLLALSAPPQPASCCQDSVSSPPTRRRPQPPTWSCLPPRPRTLDSTPSPLKLLLFKHGLHTHG